MVSGPKVIAWFPTTEPAALAELIKPCDAEGVKVLQALLVWDPMKRLGAAATLGMPFFTPCVAELSATAVKVLSSNPLKTVDSI